MLSQRGIYMKVLIADGDPKTVEDITVAIKVRWPRAKIVSVSNIQRVEAEIDNEALDIVIINSAIISPPDLLKRIRQSSGVPILCITDRRHDEGQLVALLEYGADEYLVKPLAQMELLARVNALIRLRKRTDA